MLTIENNFITYNVSITVEFDEFIIDVFNTFDGSTHNTTILIDDGLSVSEAVKEFVESL